SVGCFQAGRSASPLPGRLPGNRTLRLQSDDDLRAGPRGDHRLVPHPRVPFMNPPLVSVIMIFLDEERFISEAIQSVLAQTYSDWELLLVDDGSTDRSSELAQALER